MTNLVNCLSIDVEGFVESSMESFHIAPRYCDREREDQEIDANTNVILDILADLNVRATFFFVGRIARDIPHLVRRVAELGHEVGCHSYEHLRIFNINPHEFREQLRCAKGRLEDLAGKPIYGFRAPEFSITQPSLWALDVIRQLGFIYDTSIYPIRMHDVYGMEGGHTSIYKLPTGLIEWPLSTFSFLGKKFPFGGGGYFRLYPLAFTKLCIASMNRQGQPCMFYIHPYEVGPVIPMIRGISAYRQFRHYYHCRNGARRFRRLLKSFHFGRAINILSDLGFVSHV